jgi:cellulose biosynthesis protein BcsQ
MPKGGVGKSFLTGHLATGLAMAGRHVLAIDADPGQGQLSLRLNLERRGDLLRLFREGASDSLLQQDPRYPNLRVVTADPRDVTQFKPVIAGYGPFWPFMLKEARMQPWLDGVFDYIIFDCGPGFESEVTACIIQVATELWLPYAVEYESFDSYQNLINQLLPQARKDPMKFITHVIPNKLSLGRERSGAEADGELNERERKRAELIRRARTNDAVALLEMLKSNFGGRMTNPVRMAEALSQKTAGGGEMIWDLDPNSDVAEDLSFVIEAIIAREEVLTGGAA